MSKNYLKSFSLEKIKADIQEAIFLFSHIFVR